MRLAQRSDINSLAKLRVVQQKDDWKDEFIDENNLETRTQKYLDEHLSKDFFIFIYVIDEKIIATCGLQQINYLPQCNDNGKLDYICNVYAQKEYRKKGIQTKLLNDCIDFAREKNIDELQHSSDNTDAISIYQKQGFVFDDLIMKLELNNGGN